MKADQFWTYFDGLSHGEQAVEELTERLTGLTPEELISFDHIHYQMVIQAYKWDLWLAAYIANGGCSEDGFLYFRLGLIGLGREVFEKALEDADSLAEQPVEALSERELFCRSRPGALRKLV